jgi:hypothetical protein
MNHRLCQLHVWLREEDYRTLKQLAEDDDESLARLVRRQLRSLIRNRRSRMVAPESTEPAATTPVRRR